MQWTICRASLIDITIKSHCYKSLDFLKGSNVPQNGIFCPKQSKVQFMPLLVLVKFSRGTRFARRVQEHFSILLPNSEESKKEREKILDNQDFVKKKREMFWAVYAYTTWSWCYPRIISSWHCHQVPFHILHLFNFFQNAAATLIFLGVLHVETLVLIVHFSLKFFGFFWEL